jgi:hypothetical protein
VKKRVIAAVVGVLLLGLSCGVALAQYGGLRPFPGPAFIGVPKHVAYFYFAPNYWDQVTPVMHDGLVYLVAWNKAQGVGAVEVVTTSDWCTEYGGYCQP